MFCLDNSVSRKDGGDEEKGTRKNGETEKRRRVNVELQIMNSECPTPNNLSLPKLNSNWN